METKQCHWCKKEKPFYEYGDWELDPDTEETVGWVCNHCLADFNGWNRNYVRKGMKLIKESYNEFAEKYNEVHPECPLELEVVT